jgi:hypothetical protein
MTRTFSVTFNIEVKSTLSNDEDLLDVLNEMNYELNDSTGLAEIINTEMVSIDSAD